MSESLNNTPEQHDLTEVEQANKKYARELLINYPVKSSEAKSHTDVEPEHYWGLSVAIACAKLGVPLGFEARDSLDATQLAIRGTNDDINYWLNMTGFEHRGLRDNLANGESRSGLFTLMQDPDHSEVFEHVYALHTNTPIEEIMMRDPMFERVRFEQAASTAELVDHEGVANLHENDPRKCLRLYLTRALPHLKHLRRTIEFTKRWLIVNAEDQPTDYDDANIRKAVEHANKEAAELRPFQEARLAYWQTNYDFTVGLLLEGHKPYALEEVVPFTEEYVVSLLAIHPELSPTHLTAEVPDMQAEIKKILDDLRMRDKHNEN